MTSRVGSKQSVKSSNNSACHENSAVVIKETKKRIIKITLERCENITPFFPIADIVARCVVGENCIGESRAVPITDAKIVPIECNFEFPVDRNNIKDLDNLVTYPVFLIFDQIQGTYDRRIYPQLQDNQLVSTIIPVKSFESIISLYEALNPKKDDEDSEHKNLTKKTRKTSVIKITEQTKDKDKTKIKENTKKVRRSIGSKSSITSDIDSYTVEYKPTPFGMCTIDLLPLLFGKKKITQSMLIKPIIEYEDEKMFSYKSRPKVTVTIGADGGFGISNPNLMNFTVETIYNIPMSLMTDDLDYKLCCMMPMFSGQKLPMLFSNPVFLHKTTHCIPKCWPGIQRIGNDINTTKYRTPDDLKDLEAKFDPKVESYIEKRSLRLQYTMIKRNLLLKDSITDITTHVKVYRKIVLEFFMSKSVQNDSTVHGKNIEASSKKPLKGSYLHLMALLDVSPLLYPGVTKIRLASPLTTFSIQEAAKYGGLDESYFMPSLGRDSKTKFGETEKFKEDNLKCKLPFRSEEDLDPVQVRDEDGSPCFIVVEIELTTPLIPKKKIEDLRENLSKLIVSTKQVPQDLSKVVLTSCITVDYYKNILNKMIVDLNTKYLDYAEKSSCCHKDNNQVNVNNFVAYLKNTGIYNSYVNAISKVVSMVISKKFHLNDVNDCMQYESLIGDVFVYLISQMNQTVNKLICHGMEPVSDTKGVYKTLYFAREAMETGRREIADEYLLQKICSETENCDYWFHYGIFLLQNKEDDIAFECFKEVLSKKMDHKYCLLIFGVLLSEKNKNEDAETCFLSLMTKEFAWLEGWAVLYLFYLRGKNYEGMDMAMGMVKKYLELTTDEEDDFMDSDELVWAKAICPKTIFFRAACVLLKCRLYEWCKFALSQEVSSNSGLVNYLLSVIYYYKKLYNHALDHIEETIRTFGSNYAVASLAGHCYFALGRKAEAKDQYYWALEFYNSPVSMHLVCVQLAKILDEFRDDQEARKLILIACKYNPTPYTWMLAGKFYLQQNDLLSAEECFFEGNCIDNRYADIWGYLALVNAKLKRPNEAEICYTQAMRNKLGDPNLIAAIQSELECTCECSLLHVY